MDYFLLLPNEKLSNPLNFSANEKKFQSLEPFIIETKKVRNVTLVDLIVKKILFNTYFFLSNELKKVFEMYNKDINWVQLFVTNGELHSVYWKLDMDETKNVITNKFLKSKDMLIRPDLLNDKCIHKIHYEKQTFILVNLFVAESIIRRLPVGLLLQKVKTIEGED